MVPMRTGRVVLAFIIVVAIIAGIDFLCAVSTTTSTAHTWWSTALTAALIMSYTWLAPIVMPSLARHAITDKAAHHHVAEKLKSLSNYATSRPKLFVIEDDRPIAYGLGVPGCAAIFVTTGLTASMSGDTLRFVLAHELEHINQRHALATAFVFSGVYCAKMLMSMPAALGPVAFLGYLAIMRTCERAADRGASQVVGERVAKTALLDLKTLVGEKTQPSRWLDLLSTHPSFSSRAAKL